MSESAESTLETDLQTLDLGPEATPTAPRKNPDVRNPFDKARIKSRKSKCALTAFPRPPFKHSRKKVLREPVLKLATTSEAAVAEVRQFGIDGPEKDDFRTIIRGYEQLSLASAEPLYSAESFRGAREVPVTRPDAPAVAAVEVPAASCSHQARMSAVPPCDVTINELASYFETFIHIPKKMSDMAEMMYI